MKVNKLKTMRADTLQLSEIWMAVFNAHECSKKKCIFVVLEIVPVDDIA